MWRPRHAPFRTPKEVRVTWTVWKNGELHDAQFKEPPFLVEPLFPTGGVGVLHGPKTAGKTQLALTLGVAVANGTPFLNEYRCQQGPVVFVEADMPRYLLHDRVKLVNAARALWFVHSEPFDAVELAAKGSAPDYVEQAREARPSLVIIDSLRKTHRLDENDSTTPTVVYGAWKKLFPGSALLFLHHDRKKPTNPQAFMHREEASRGTGAWLDDVDIGLQLDRVRQTKQDGHSAVLTFSKCRTTEEPAPIVLHMNIDSLLLEPSKPTVRHQLTAWKIANPRATADDAREWLRAEKLCGKSVAYKLTTEIWA